MNREQFDLHSMSISYEKPDIPTPFDKRELVLATIKLQSVMSAPKSSSKALLHVHGFMTNKRLSRMLAEMYPYTENEIFNVLDRFGGDLKLARQHIERCQAYGVAI